MERLEVVVVKILLYVMLLWSNTRQSRKSSTFAPFSAEATQIGTIKAVDSTIYSPSEKLTSSHTRQLIIEDFT